MYKNILVPMALDHDLSPDTLEVARALLQDGGQIVALHVYDTPQGAANAYMDEATIAAAYKAAKARLHEKVSHLDGVTAKITEGHSARTIIDYADEHKVDCIVIGSHRPDLRDYFLGSTASRVVRHAKCAVHVYRRDG
ncbi:universal stress protein [Roseovarius sp. 2305UL8-3]|uniref:universal stress protein n=1 Tax=Roseovarius conchicola TaxID=3121636 RepID=UPI0035278CDE